METTHVQDILEIKSWTGETVGEGDCLNDGHGPLAEAYPRRAFKFIPPC